MADCATQRNLSVAGAANSVQTGDYIRRLRIPIGDVLSSPMCRCSETARLAFGRVQAIPSLMGNWAETNRSMDDAGRDLVQLVKTNVQAGRSEERRVGKECVSQCRSRWSPYPYKNKI